MFKDNDRISSLQVVFFITANIIEVGTLTAGRELTREVGPDSWLVFILGQLFATFSIFIMVKLGQRFYRHGFVDYSRIIAGRIIGWLIAVTLVVYWLFVAGRVLFSVGTIVRLTLLDSTPHMVVYISFILLAVYISRHGIEPLCRISVIITLTVFPAIIILSLTVIGKFRFDTFLPFLANGPMPVFKKAFLDIADLEEMSFFLFLVFFMNKPRNAVKTAFVSWLIPTLFAFYTIFLHVGALGSEMSKLQLMPTITSLESAKIPGAFIERLGVIFSGLWIIVAFPSLCGLLYAIALVISQAFGRNNFKPFIIPAAVVILLISLIPRNTIQSDSFFKFLTPYGLTVLLAVPLLLYITAMVRKLKDE